MELIDVIKKNNKGEGKSTLLSMSKKLPVLTPSSYWAIVGMTGTGKTSLTDQLFVLDLMESSYKIKWIYRSMERNIVYKHAKWLSYIIYIKEGIMWDFHTIMQDAAKLFTFDDKQIKIVQHYYKWMKENLLPKITLIQNRDTPIAIKDRLEKFLISHRRDYDFVIHITDHIGKIKGNNPYQVMTDYSNEMGELRDKYGIIAVDIAQVHQKRVSDAYRRKSFGAEVLTSDIYGGEILAQNCDVMLAVINPEALGSEAYMGYDLSKFHSAGDSRFRAAKVIKYNFGSLTTIPCLFLGETGHFRELPNSSNMNYDAIQPLMYN